MSWNPQSRLENLQQTINADLSADDSELQVYQELLSSVDDEIRAKDQEASDLRDKAAALTAENSRLVALMTGYGHSTAKADVDSDLLRVRDAVLALYESKPTLTQGLELIQGLYHDRVEVLDSAFKSAEDSDAARFRYSEKATDLLLKLVTKYWEILAGGGSDQLAKDCFGAQTYSANEARLSSRGRSERTFFYRGEQVFMDKHLKIGGKDSLATTLRIHFEWFSDEKKIIIGHCGRHLTL